MSPHHFASTPSPNTDVSGAVPTLSASDPKKANQARVQYHGRNPDGRFRIKIKEQKFLLTGAIYALSKSNDHRGNELLMKLLLDMTPGYRVEKNDEISYDAICATTGMRMAVLGRATPASSPKVEQGADHGEK